ncbi:hypothetical protein HGA13_01600 [Nocardia speluncae]|uniref:Uncharacterized protein n=1 Tax=Nocardia speluncae TaxID=419477 RepID=A0A846X769_9NOCA|nr:hypothetical protein [Nocardia speluncae]NKY31772.1 hypothetical protein [Nocardia speluncae]
MATEGEEGTEGEEATEGSDSAEGTEEVAAEPEAPLWSTLTDLATDGKLVVEDGIAFECAARCAYLMGVLDAIKLDGKLLGAFPAAYYAEPPIVSLDEYDKKLAGMGTKLYELIGYPGKEGTHLDGLDNMLAAFKAAGKSYQETDSSSAAEFDLDSVDQDSATGAFVERSPHSGSLLDEEFLRGRLEAMELIDPYPLMPDWPSDLSFEQLYELGNYIRSQGMVTSYQEKGTQWYQMGDTILGASTDFMNKLVGSTADAWTGEGREGAIAASSHFNNQHLALVEAMFRVGDSYRLAAYWLETTEEAMPPEKHNWAGTYERFDESRPNQFALDDEYTWRQDMGHVLIVDDPTGVYRQSYRNTYVEGFNESNAMFPMFPAFSAGIDPVEVTDETTEMTEDDQNYDSNTYPAPTDGGGLYPDLGGENVASLRAGVVEEDLLGTPTYPAAGSDPVSAALEQGSQALQQGLGMAEQAMNAGLGAVEESLANSGLPGGLPTDGPPLGADSALVPGLPVLQGGGPGGNVAGGLGPGGNVAGGLGSGVTKPSMDPAKLFPRAGLTGGSSPAVGSAGPQAAGSPMGSPMGGSPGAGAPGGRGGQNDDKHERAKYLDRVDNLDEALGDPVEMTRSVVGETAPRGAAAEFVQQPAPPVRPAPPSREPVRSVVPEQPVIVPQAERG